MLGKKLDSTRRIFMSAQVDTPRRRNKRRLLLDRALRTVLRVRPWKELRGTRSLCYGLRVIVVKAAKPTWIYV